MLQLNIKAAELQNKLLANQFDLGAKFNVMKKGTTVVEFDYSTQTIYVDTEWYNKLSMRAVYDKKQFGFHQINDVVNHLNIN